MKTRTKFLNLAALLLAGVGFATCNNLETTGAEDGKMILPVLASSEVSAFFKEYLPESNNSRPLPEFDFGDVDHNDAVCLIINSDEEFRTVAPFSIKLPSIEFDKYTLIIGQHPMGDPGYSFEKQSIDTEPDKIKLSLEYKRMEGATPAIVVTFYYWALYPKLPQKPITVNVITI